ncbi:5'-AMP-activated protein kinase subunit beta-1 [Pseudolycoriella hygida]|uniref:5'-AMP-activated protein kinase subunit beta-1 n=1 Tax=Pseudolycoriella hygida TaxID=35572 RepID=A0A9Q0NG21_9DIPT|nr:5'-AMP-activated protein kinase subunit beta-1 [Pseudolycoriella hygida]
MGNAGSTVPRERHKSSPGISSHDILGSPIKEGQAFVFDKKIDNRLIFQGGSNEEEEPYYTKPALHDPEFDQEPRKRSNTLDAGNENEKELNKAPALPTVFKWDGGGRQVFISGTFSEWKTIPMVRSHGDFVTIIDLPEGDHQYKFCVDGEWRHDPKLKNIDNDIGTKNNLVSVRKSDFEVFQALAKDIEEGSSTTQKEYSQDIPAVKPWEKVSGPPVLPPHLLQVILNKDTPLSCEPTLLPEPNHVMLNHLYALSIKDGVMVLSATHRYRKKYVTTLLYKPI